MAQYINREKLLKRMEGYCKANCGCKPNEDALCPSCGLGDAIYMVEEQRIVNSRNMMGRKDAIEVVSKTEKTTRWIPVTERLPEKDTRVIVCASLPEGVHSDFIYEDGHWFVSIGVTHWMPFPEPPKEEA